MFSCSSKVHKELRERLSVQDVRKMGGGTEVKQVLASTLQSTLLHLEGQLVAVKVDPATACSPSRQQKKEVRGSLGWPDRHNVEKLY